MAPEAIQELLDQAYEHFANEGFVEHDPVAIPHQFSRKEDIEISAFLTAVIAWGQRKSIISNARRMLTLMDNAPHEFITGHSETERKKFKGFVHRTFQEPDLLYFIDTLQYLYTQKHGLEGAFSGNYGMDAKARLAGFHQIFFSREHLPRTEKHIGNPMRGSAAKRINMFLRWMVRSDKEGVDFGIWKSIATADLMVPLDVHTSTIGRKLGLLKRQQDDWKAVEELTAALRNYDASDPVKYDFALFGLGVDGWLH